MDGPVEVEPPVQMWMVAHKLAHKIIEKATILSFDWSTFRERQTLESTA